DGESPDERPQALPARLQWKEHSQAGRTVAARGARAAGRGKSGLHRARWWVTPTVRSGASARRRTGIVQQQGYRLVRGPLSAVRSPWQSFLAMDDGPRTTDDGLGKGEMVGGRKSLNVRAHQQPGDRLARQTPPGARPNKRAGSARSVTDSRVGRWIGRATGRL